MTDAHLWSRSDTARMLRVADAADDKYSRGVVGLRTGSARYPGAAVLGVEGAWRAGAGLVRYLGDDLPRMLVLQRRPETVVVDGRVGAWVIGSGSDATHRTHVESAEQRALLNGETPVVVDAGALDLALDAGAPMIVTPHAGEFRRLRDALGLESSSHAAPEATADRLRAAAEVARALGATVLLKGAETVVADARGMTILVKSRTSWLATAGTGDVLAGMIGAVVAANPSGLLAESAAAAAWLHGEAAAVASGTSSPPKGGAVEHPEAEGAGPGHPIVALDIAEALPSVIAAVLAS